MKRRAPDDITVDTKAVLSGILQNMDMAGIALHDFIFLYGG